jgi:hypothetical protein
MNRTTVRLLLATWLALSVVGTQLAGLVHRIEHPVAKGLADGRAHRHAAHVLWPDPVHGSSVGAAAAEPVCADGHEHPAPGFLATVLALLAHAHSRDGTGHHDQHPHHDPDAPAHDCAAYDAATVGDSSPAAVAGAYVVPVADAGPLARSVQRPAGPRALAFRSRAPPAP